MGQQEYDRKHSPHLVSLVNKLQIKTTQRMFRFTVLSPVVGASQSLPDWALLAKPHRGQPFGCFFFLYLLSLHFRGVYHGGRSVIKWIAQLEFKIESLKSLSLVPCSRDKTQTSHLALSIH